MRWQVFDEHGVLAESYPDASQAVAALNRLPSVPPSIDCRPMVIAVDEDNVRIPGAIHRHAA
jgi:hypothetical protein